MSMVRWEYFNLVLVDEEGDVYKLVDEAGQPLRKDGRVLLFASCEEAEAYLEEHNIRGSVR